MTPEQHKLLTDQFDESRGQKTAVVFDSDDAETRQELEILELATNGCDPAACLDRAGKAGPAGNSRPTVRRKQPIVYPSPPSGKIPVSSGALALLLLVLRSSRQCPLLLLRFAD